MSETPRDTPSSAIRSRIRCRRASIRRSRRQFGIDAALRRHRRRARRTSPSAVRDFFAAGGAGANVTVPHKHAALALADSHSEAAATAGAANVLTPQADGSLAAHNNDGAGLVRDLTERHRLDLRGHDALLLGAGGAAQGVAAPLLDAGVRYPDHRQPHARTRRCPRRPSGRAGARAQPLLGRPGHPGQLRPDRQRHLGRRAGAGTGPAVLADRCRARCATTCPTAVRPPGFLAWARAAGARYALDGLGMLVETAADSFALWHGKRPDTDAVYDALRADGT